ncbi:hypothetical protein [Pseudoroseicyclus sp. CXY001]|uniref:hypothetical protein n=1 Tax=Pseudoroseicyclus sp. CXY001 TaxID=3242492 RepID=UPI003570D5C5
MRAPRALAATLLALCTSGGAAAQDLGLMEEAIGQLDALAATAAPGCLVGAPVCAEDGPEALVAALCRALVPGVAQGSCGEIAPPRGSDPRRLFLAVQDGLTAALDGTVPGPDGQALSAAILRRATGEPVALPVLTALPPATPEPGPAPEPAPGAAAPASSDLPDPLPTDPDELQELALALVFRAAQEGWDDARRDAALTTLRDALNGGAPPPGEPAEPSPAELIAAATARARGEESCAGVTIAEGPGPHPPLAEVHLDLPPGFLGPDRAMAGVYIAGEIALPLLLLPGADGRPGVTLPLHPDGLGGGAGRIAFGWEDEETGATITCQPIPLDIAAATPEPGAWLTAMAGLADATALLERGANWAGMPMGSLPRSLERELGTLEAEYAELAPEERAILDLLAPRVSPDPQFIAAMGDWIDSHPAPLQRGALDLVPGGPERLWHAAGGDAGGGQSSSHICPADAREIREWILLGEYGQHNTDPLLQAEFTAGTVLAGASAHLLFAAGGMEKAGQYAERGIGVAAGSYNLFMNFMAGVAPYKITAIEGRFEHETLSEDTSDLVLELADVALHTDSRGWSPLRGAVDLGLIVLAAAGKTTPVGGQISRQAERVGLDGVTNIASRQGMTFGAVLFEEGAKALSATLGAIADAALLDALWKDAISEIEKDNNGLVRPRCRVPDPTLSALDAFLVDRHWRSARPIEDRPGQFLPINEGLVGVELSIKPDIELPRDRVADPIEAWMEILPAALAPGESDLVIEPGQEAYVEVTGLNLENPLEVDWQVEGDAALSWAIPSAWPRDWPVLRILTSDDPEDFPITVTATMSSLTLEGSQAEPPVLAQVITTGEVEATVLPACAWRGARVEVRLNDLRTGRPLSPADYEWTPGEGLTSLAPGLFGVTETGPPSLVLFGRPGDRGKINAVMVRRDCACGPEAFPDLVTELQPFSRSMLAMFGQQAFAFVGTGTVEISGDITQVETFPGMRLTMLTAQDETDLSCRYTSALTTSEMGIVEAMRSQRADLFFDDAGSNMFDGTGGFSFAGPGVIAPGGDGSFSAPIPYRGGELSGGFEPQLPPFVAVQAFGPDRLEIIAQARGCDVTDVDRGFPTRRTNFYDTLRTCATHEARFIADQRP